jgi:hypothetical protein
MIVISMNHIVGHWIRSVAERLTGADTAEAVETQHSPPESWEATRAALRLRCFLEIGVG